VSALPRTTEDEEAQAFVAAFRRQWPTYAHALIHVANEGGLRSFSPGYHKKRERMGVLKGVSDYFLAYPVGKYHGLFLELKGMGGSLKPEQADFLEQRDVYGYATAVAWGWVGAFAATNNYLSGGVAVELVGYTGSAAYPLTALTLTGTPRRRRA
jgi:hypothetical protein